MERGSACPAQLEGCNLEVLLQVEVAIGGAYLQEEGSAPAMS